MQWTLQTNLKFVVFIYAWFYIFLVTGALIAETWNVLLNFLLNMVCSFNSFLIYLGGNHFQITCF